MAGTGQPETVERIVNLAMYLSAAREPVKWEDIQSEVAGYPSEQSREAFLRMFERDKKQLRESGLVIAADAEGRYLLDESATYSTEVTLSDEESAAVRAAAVALIDDPAFPFSQDLRLAIAKLGPGSDVAPCSARLADEEPERQGRDTALIADAAQRCKRVSFEYTTSAGARAARSVDPYGAFVRDGRWYLVGYDTNREGMRTFSLSRAENLQVNDVKQTTPDFERPADFDVASYVRLPFQFGSESFQAVVEFDEDLAWRARSLAAGQGVLEQQPDGVLRWTVEARSGSRLARWVIESGPGVRVMSPSQVTADVLRSLEEVRHNHG